MGMHKYRNTIMKICYTYPIAVDDINNDSELASILALGDLDHPTQLHKLLEKLQENKCKCMSLKN